ncbi:hypothetical protein EHQ68_08795 [Leptospira congkakensis]|uniref:Galactose oxidase n=1 Tax=Leptospira congkakensis TaxID=2484932 RepID=A0A4Z1AF58_9LEPT|nr:hypothetical protein [Leptospira congkakensis]TGL88725.1 hypothetical protein EHQ69_14865 [Leptospira congkakensis]TGL89311.1 hypothetical protein EHQ68_08795 [Leptospira congkakensis]TGL97279.1 hypothetical protein EHQ70_08290 [Leptospira congkakensis]
MFRIFSISCIYVVSITTFTLCKPAELENTCDARSQSYLLASVIRYATGDRSPSCLPAFSFFDEWGVYDPTAAKVTAIESYQGQIIVGGNFSMTGVPTGNIAMVDSVTGMVVPNRFCPHLKVNGSYSTAISDGSGGFYIGGDFTHVQGIKRSKVAHILPGCQLDPNFVVDEDASRGITTFALLGANLYVGGLFTGWGSGSQSNIASVNRYTGNLNLEFVTDTFNSGVFDIVTDGVALYVGGHFSNIGATTRYGLVKLSPSTGAIDSTFTGQAPVGGQVNDLHLGTDHLGTPVLYVVGPFTGRAISFFLNGTQTSWAPNPNIEVVKVNQYENTIYLGGDFTTIGGIASNYLVGVDNQLGAIKENSFAINNYVRYLTVIGNKLYVLGEFTAAKGQKRNSAASFDLPSQSLNVWDPNLNSLIYFPSGEIVPSGSSLLIASNHSALNMKYRKNFVVFEEATGSPIEGTPNFDFQISSLLTKDNRLFVGGSFENVNGIPRKALAVLDLPTYNLSSTDLNITGSSAEIRTITSNHNQIFFGGFSMTGAGGQTRSGAAAIDSTTFSLTNWNPNIVGSPNTMMVVNDLVYIGGIYSSLNGNGAISNYRAVDTINGTISNFPSNAYHPNNGVYTQTIYDGRIYIGGIMTNIGILGTFQNMATYDTKSNSYITPNPIYSDGGVLSMATSPEGKVIVLGSFLGLNGTTASQFMNAFDAKTNTVLEWHPNADDVGNSSHFKNGKWYIGGDFKKVFNKPYGGFFVSDLTEKNNN